MLSQLANGQGRFTHPFILFFVQIPPPVLMQSIRAFSLRGSTARSSRRCRESAAWCLEQRRRSCRRRLGTIAMFDVMAPSMAFSVDTTGLFSPSGHSVR